jgi:antitoxin (DNA-binding transcriptional repressor) of toxin-antitoxin stability system
MRELSRNTKSVIEDVVRSGKPAIVTINGRPQAAVTPLAGAIEAAEEHLLRNAPAHIQAAIREGEADLIGGRASLVDDAVFRDLEEEDEQQAGEEVVAKLAGQLDTAALEDTIRSASEGTDAVERVRDALIRADVFAIGSPTGDPPTAGRVTESAIVTLPAEIENRPGGVLMPVFTSVDVLRSVLLRNPDWQSLDILQVNGRELAQNVDPDVTIIIDPWSDLEFRIPPTGRRTMITEQPIAAAAEIVA